MLLEDIARRAPFQRFEVVIPVRGLKSGEGLLDKNMYKALKAKDVPEIRFLLQSYRTLPAGEGGAMPFEAAGSLSISGVQKPVTLRGTARVEGDRLRVDGDYDLVMTDYGVKPPTLFLGTIKVADPVQIHFRLVFEAAVR
jgi:polyisoprenoid-binding protein YceI